MMVAPVDEVGRETRADGAVEGRDVGDIHLVVAFVEDVCADIILGDAANVINLAQSLVVEQFYDVEEVDSRHHLIYFDLGVGRCHLGDDVAGFLY